MPLKRLNYGLGGLIEHTIDLDFISVKCQHGLQSFDRLLLLATREKASAPDSSWFDQMTNPCGMKLVVPRICFTLWCDVRMREYVFRTDFISATYAAAKLDNCFNLAVRKGRIIFKIARIDDFDPD